MGEGEHAGDLVKGEHGNIVAVLVSSEEPAAVLRELEVAGRRTHRVIEGDLLERTWVVFQVLLRNRYMMALRCIPRLGYPSFGIQFFKIPLFEKQIQK